jgi:TPR repeat protein
MLGFLFGTEAELLDYERARFWFEKAAESGFALAEYSLGLMYAWGTGVGPDLQKARTW